jgi:Tol biopolymer transport system component
MTRRPIIQRSLIVALGLILISSILLSACGQVDAQFSTPISQMGADPTGRILFVADEEVRMWDGGDIRQITEVDDEHEALSPTWAPDGQRFAYVQSDRNKGYSDLYVANLDGETLKQVTNNAPDVDPFSQEFVCNAYWVADPVWDPSGERIIWASDLG